MSRLGIAFAAVLSAVTLLPAPSRAADGKAEYSIGIGAGYFLPLGDWKSHRYAGIDQFSGHAAVGGDFEIRWYPLLGFALHAGYAHLGIGEWEDYAGASGDAVDASAFIVSAGIAWRPHLWEDVYSALTLVAGVDYSMPSGRETFENLTYDYDFMRRGIGYRLGIEFEREVGRSVALTVSALALFVPSGIEYADGVKYTIVGLPLTAGVRFRF